MTQDDRMETITDPAAIRATDEPDERTPNEVHVDESGCSCKTGPYRGFQRDPIDAACPKHGGPLRHGDGDVTVCHPDGSTTIIREPDERGDFPCCATPAPVGAGLDLDALHETICDNFTGMAEVRQAADLLVAEVRRLTEFRDWWKASSLANAEDVRRLTATCHDWRDMSEAAESEVVTLRAKLTAVEAIHGRTHWCFGGDDPDDLRDNIVFEPNTEWWPCPTIAALAVTTGEGQ